MKLLTIRNFNCVAQVLEYDVERGVRRVLERAAAEAVDRGFFIELCGHYHGVFATQAGPVAFMDDRQWLLVKPVVSSELTALPDGRKRFVLAVEGNVAYEVTYWPPTVMVDNWSDDECMIDFFLWLHEGITIDPKSKLFSHYRLPA